MNKGKNADDILKRIGQNLTRLKKERNDTFGKIYNATGISVRTLNSIFKGHRALKIQDICVLADYFKISPYAIMFESMKGYDDSLIKIEKNYGAFLAYSLLFLMNEGFVHRGFGDGIDRCYLLMENGYNINGLFDDLIKFNKEYGRFEIDEEDDGYRIFQSQIIKKYVDDFNKKYNEMRKND